MASSVLAPARLQLPIAAAAQQHAMPTSRETRTLASCETSMVTPLDLLRSSLNGDRGDRGPRSL